MRAGHSEGLTMLGHALGVVVASVLGEWARESGRESLGDVMVICSVLFQVAFFFGVVRLLSRAMRWSGGLFVRRRRTAPRRSSEPSGF
ncbi:hypothetical protein DP939_08660 [Spongiactinospora rosea]|uniref:Uncharacterized protein n=1 Tax=Spongiactinospora rosea TaxID=2248750 RepID=A0A366M4Z9_9ACTN|nr:hypothetical protein [Spongiactinospora rosea]RBQ21107.1 hypothetical protein DP939_08660 [Spongiactinospora rosea]